MTLVVDASVVFAALVDSSPDGEWAEIQISGGDLIAPHLLPVEVSNALQRAERAGRISVDVASLAFDGLQQLPVSLAPFEPFADRIWALRGGVTSYDAWYVALAESLAVRLATLDIRLSRAPGPECDFIVPPPRTEPRSGSRA